MIKHILLTVAATLLCICRIDAQYRLNMDSIINGSIRIVTKDIISKNPEYAEYGRIVLTDNTLPPFFKFDSKEKHLGILRASSMSQDELIAKKNLGDTTICLNFCISSEYYSCQEFITFEVAKYLLHPYKQKDGIQIIYKLNEDKNIWEYIGIVKLPSCPLCTQEDDFPIGLTKDSIDIESDVYSNQTFHIYSDSNIFYKYIAPSEIIFCKELNDYYNLVNNVVIDDISIEPLTRKVLENKANGKFLFNSLCKEEIVSNLKQTDKDVFYWITWDDMDIYGNTLSIKLSLKGCKLDKNGHLNIDNLGYRKFRYIINSD